MVLWSWFAPTGHLPSRVAMSASAADCVSVHPAMGAWGGDVRNGPMEQVNGDAAIVA